MSVDVTMDNVKEATAEFLRRHWTHDVIDAEKPEWEHIWNFDCKVPGRDYPGCYALLAGESVLYVGVGGSDPDPEGKYAHHGLGRRISNYWKTADEGSETKYQPMSKWAERGVDAIAIIPFPHGYGYLAYGLEAFLINELHPPENMAKPGAG